MNTLANIQELARALRNMIRTGLVVETDLNAGRCRVQTGGMCTDWLQWLTHRAGRSRKRDAYQFLGVGEENMTLAGVLYPELTGGKLTMTTLRLMAEEGRAWPLLDGTGMIYGMYVISRVSETGSIFFADGTPRKIDFTLSLTRVDESLAALYGDIGKQAESLIGKAGSMATRFTGMTGAG
ncbi:TPA: phage baseplate assembly protein V [Escherichia coli]|nr:phage baseplate assembly protein V [Escherichia coli]